MKSTQTEYKISTENKQVILTFTDDSSWLFAGFIKKNGLMYVRFYAVRTEEDSRILATEPTDMYIVQVDQYCLAQNLNELIQKGLHRKCDPNQMFIDSFFAAVN